MGPTPLSSGPRDADIMTLRGTSCTCWCDARFSGAIAPRIDLGDPLGWAGLEVVKESTVRTVLRGDVGGFDVHVKLFRAVRLSDRARDALSGARSAKEMRNLLEARRRGLPCVEPLCAGRWTGTFGARSFLVTRTVEGARPLGPGPWPEPVAQRAGTLLRQVHDAGLHALDLHPGNVVQTPGGALVMLDLTSASMSEPLENIERANALAFFCAGLDGGVRNPGAAPLVDAYGASTSLLARSEQVGRRLRSRALDAFGRRAGRSCRHTEIVAEPDATRWFMHRPATELHQAARDFAAGARPAPLRSGRRGSVWSVEPLVVKQRPAAAARRLFRAAYWLQFAGAATAEPVALRLHHGTGLVFSRHLGSPCLLDRITGRELDDDALVAAARSLGRSVGRLHAHGLRNRDLKLENLVLDPRSGEVAMVDLDGVRRKAPMDRRGQAADLGRLLAAWQDTSHPAFARVVRTFWRQYHRARACLLSTPAKDLRRRSEVRAREWARTHRKPPDPSPSAAG